MKVTKIEPTADAPLPQTGQPWRYDAAPEWERAKARAWCRARFPAWRALDAMRAEIAARPGCPDANA